MTKIHVAKLFKNGASQAVRLPMEYRFEGDQVYISRDEVTGNVVLSSRPGLEAWESFFALAQKAQDLESYMVERPMNRPPLDKDVFGPDEP